VDTTTLAHDADRRARLVSDLLTLVDSAGKGRSWTPSPAFDRAVTRWSRQAESPLDVLVLVAEVRRSRRPLSRAHQAALEHLTLVAVAAVSERMVGEALTDALTGLATRARLEDEVQHLIASSVRTQTPLTAVVIDVDGLKHLNDSQGHAAGDAALAELGRAIRTNLRRVDRTFRVGGDEFALFMPSTTPEEARSVIERIQQHCTTPFSVGMTTHSGDRWDTDVAGLVQQADAEMYEQRQQLRAILLPGVTRTGKARVVGMVLAAGLSVGAWAGIAVAVHGVVSDGPTTTSAQAPGSMTTVPVGTSTTVASTPRTVGPAVVTAGAPATTGTQPVGRTSSTPPITDGVPAVGVPAVDVPQLPVEVPTIEPPSVPATPEPGSTGLLGALFRTLGNVLNAVV